MLALLASVFLSATSGEAPADSWPRFRGPNGSGIAADGASPPVEFGPGRNAAWVTEVPAGVSSPCVWGDRAYVTGFLKETGRLETLCLDRKTGGVLWRRAAPEVPIERFHETGSPASATPAADATRVVVYFGSFGLLCYDHDGNELWKRELPRPAREFGSGTSPVLAGKLVLLNRDENPAPQLLAFEAATGEVAWKTAHPPIFGTGMSEGNATPVLLDGLAVLHRPDGLGAYDLADGRRRWWVNGTSTACSSAAVADGIAYVATWNNFGEPDLRADLPTFDAVVKANDRDGDGLISKEEFPGDLAVSRRPGATAQQGGEVLAKPFFDSIDLNKDGKLNTLEWTAAAAIVQVMAVRSEHGLLAVRAGGDGDVTGSAVVWKEKKYIPEIPSPLVVGGRVYVVKDGGVVTCFDAGTGKVVYRKRLGADGAYYASPVAADGRIYFASNAGVVTVAKAGDAFEVLARDDLAEPITATPAIVGDTLYVRTAGRLYAFREAK